MGWNQEVSDLEGARLVGWQGWPPRRIVGEIRLGVGADDADDDLGNDAPADLAQVIASAADRRLAKDVQPEGRIVLPVAEGELLPRQRLRPDSIGDRFAGRQASAHSPLQISRGEDYAWQSINNYKKSLFVPADRGIIKDRKGAVLVDNRP